MESGDSKLIQNNTIKQITQFCPNVRFWDCFCHFWKNWYIPTFSYLQKEKNLTKKIERLLKWNTEQNFWQIGSKLAIRTGTIRNGFRIHSDDFNLSRAQYEQYDERMTLSPINLYWTNERTWTTSRMGNTIDKRQANKKKLFKITLTTNHWFQINILWKFLYIRQLVM